jgi:hypothetical protein
MSIKINDTQVVLLSAASQRGDRCLVPPAGPKRSQAQRAVAKLLEAGLVKEIRAKAGAPIWRRDEETGHGRKPSRSSSGVAPHARARPSDPVAAFGDFDRTILRRLREPWDEAVESGSARPFATRGPITRGGVGLKSGALLVREWNGRLERVIVLDEGFAWDGGVYPSLSQVARAITGTNWNGHRFFGLKGVGGGGPSKVGRRGQAAQELRR